MLTALHIFLLFPSSEKPFDQMGTIEAHFITGSGKRMVRWRKYDGSLHTSPEPME